LNQEIRFFMRNLIKSRRLFWAALLGLFPVVMTLILILAKPFLEDRDVEVFRLYPQISFFLYLHFLLPMTAVFSGSAVIGEEVEDQTLPYLLIRPIPKWRFAVSKILANFLVLGSILILSLFLCYTVLHLPYGLSGWLDESGQLARSIGVLLLGLAAYLPLFSFLGALFKKAVLGGLLFTFGWENLIAYLPGNAKLLTVVHYLHSLYPTFFRSNTGGILGMLPIKITMTKDIVAIFVLLMIAAAGFSLTALVLTVREYRLERG